MENLPKLNFPACRLRARKSPDGQTLVWDECRRIWIVLTPEEWVRRHLVACLTGGMGIPPSRLTLEYPVTLNGMCQRADLVVAGADGSPLLLAECKAPGVSIDGTVLAQAVRYNSVLGARYIMLTNGLKSYLYESVDGEYAALESMPVL